MPDARTETPPAGQAQAREGVVEMRAFPVSDCCWRCGQRLMRLEPPWQEWSYYCHSCGHVTLRKEELQEQRRQQPEGATGFVAAVSVRITLVAD